MKLSNAERETIVLFSETNEPAEIYTYNASLIRKIEKAVAEHPEIFKIKSRDNTGAVTCILPKDRLSILLKLPVSKERSESASKRMKEYHENKKNNESFNT